MCNICVFYYIYLSWISEITWYLLQQSLVKLEGWEDIVTIISCDMRYWDASEKSDILVCDYILWLICWIYFSEC
jgi:hypothetical protein